MTRKGMTLKEKQARQSRAFLLNERGKFIKRVSILNV
jgi:hypothetical protein